ncbi:uncharacterized protein L199_001066 [Kwoniella botswanensis]|uniref:uncharacterized protein n=1 Tax=Kwoniella botswanensis TaxID=1268659 RepID=UPI00315C52CA
MSSPSDIIARPSPAREGEDTDQYDLMVAVRNTEKRMKLAEGFVTLLQQDKGKSYIGLPFSCGYGFNIRLGYDVCLGPDCQLIDVCPIKIGNRTMLGGSVEESSFGPGVKIGNGVTIGAGSVVTKDTEDRVVAVGNPARPIKKILEDGTTVLIPKA